MWRRIWGLAALLIVAATAGLLWRFGSAAGLAVELALPMAEPVLGVFRDHPERRQVRIPTSSGHSLLADLYRSERRRGALLLVHGLSPAGRRQPDLARLARLLASRGLVVVVPQFEGLAAFRLTGSEVSDVRAALRYTAALGELPSDAPVGIAGFSFGAGPAIIAAADMPNLSVVSSFGGYADLRNVLIYITTGTHSFAGRQYHQPPEQYNRWKMLAVLAALVPSVADREQLNAIAGRKLGDPGADTAPLERGLGPQGRALLALVVNGREDAVDRLVAALPPALQAALGSLSPLDAVARVRGRLILAHGAADASIPFTETLRLAAAAGGRAHVALFETFHHTGLASLWSSPAQHGRDGWRLVQLLDELMTR